MYNIEIKPKVENDIIHYRDFIMKEYGADDSVHKAVVEIFNAIELLAEFPKVNRNLGDLNVRANGIYRSLVRDRVILYRIDEEKKLVSVRRVLSQRESYISIILQDETTL
jgi:plasmid stabilization system protein ParE